MLTGIAQDPTASDCSARTETLVLSGSKCRPVLLSFVFSTLSLQVESFFLVKILKYTKLEQYFRILTTYT